MKDTEFITKLAHHINHHLHDMAIPIIAAPSAERTSIGLLIISVLILIFLYQAIVEKTLD